jgi:hypothetical protein
MKCNLCKRRVRNSFMDKLTHMMNYHPDKLLDRLSHIPELSYNFGAAMAESIKGVFNGRLPQDTRNR